MSLNRIIKVLIVDDSLFFRTALQNALLKDPGISVVGTAGSAAEAAKKIQDLSPDVITMDVEMPDMKGTDFLKKLIPRRPVPVVLVSSLDLGIFDALDAGAVDFIRKPAARTDYNMFFTELTTKIRIASTARVKAKAPSPLDSLPTPALSPNNKAEKIIAIGASTGGTEARNPEKAAGKYSGHSGRAAYAARIHQNVRGAPRPPLQLFCGGGQRRRTRGAGHGLYCAGR